MQQKYFFQNYLQVYDHENVVDVDVNVIEVDILDVVNVSEVDEVGVVNVVGVVDVVDVVDVADVVESLFSELFVRVWS